MAAGDWEEHALLLLNYFLYTDKNSDYKSYLVIGKYYYYYYIYSGIPEGDTIYVLRVNRDLSERVLWNASTGYGYLTTDLNCPLRKIYILVSSTNVYGNMQKFEEPWKIEYDVDNTKQWLRLFSTDKDTQMLNSVLTCQDENPEYIPIPEEVVIRLKDVIEDHVCRKLEEWRNGEISVIKTMDPDIRVLK